MESQRNSTSSENKEEEELELEEEEEENDEILRRRISSHPLYELLLETHLECLKVGDISNLEREQKMIAQKQAKKKHELGTFSQSELDLFMEAYCVALGKLKEAMEEPQQKSMDFINNMHSQLRELTRKPLPASDSDEAEATPAEATPSSSCDCNSQRDSTA